MTLGPSADGTDARRVGVVWVEAIQETLPGEFDDETVEQYVDLIFGHPVLVMGRPDPDEVVSLVADLLERHPPARTLDIDASLDDDTRADLETTLLDYTREGVRGDRPGPVGVVPESGPTERGASGPEAPSTTEGPSAPTGPGATKPGASEGFASDIPDSEAMQIVELKDWVSDLIETFDLSDDDVRIVLKEVIDQLEDTEDG